MLLKVQKLLYGIACISILGFFNSAWSSFPSSEEMGDWQRSSAVKEKEKLLEAEEGTWENVTNARTAVSNSSSSSSSSSAPVRLSETFILGGVEDAFYGESALCTYSLTKVEKFKAHIQRIKAINASPLRAYQQEENATARNMAAASSQILDNDTLTDESEHLLLAQQSLEEDDNPYTWDSSDLFKYQFDQSFFSTPNKKIVAISALSGLVGASVSSPSCGYILSNIGDFLDIPLSGPLQVSTISWIVVTTTPAFIRQFWNGGELLSQRLLRQRPFASHPSDFSPEEEESTPQLYSKSGWHQLAKGSLFLSSLIDAALPTLLMIDAEHAYPAFIALTGGPFYLSWAGNAYRCGSEHIEDLFSRYSYSSRPIQDHKKILTFYLEKFQEVINHKKYASFTHERFQLLYEHFKDKEMHLEEEDTPFLFSALFLKDAQSLGSHSQEDTDNSALGALYFRKHLEKIESSWKEKALETLSVGMTGAAAYARYAIMQSVLEHGLTTLLEVDPSIAEYTSIALSAFSTSFRILTQYPLQKHAFRGYLDALVFNPLRDCQVLRKTLNLTSLVNSVLFALPQTVAGLNTFTDLTLGSKVALLAPEFVTNMNYHNQFFCEKSDENLTSILCLASKSKNPPLPVKRAFLNALVNQAKPLIQRLDNESTTKLYNLLLGGI